MKGHHSVLRAAAAAESSTATRAPCQESSPRSAASKSGAVASSQPRSSLSRGPEAAGKELVAGGQAGKLMTSTEDLRP